MGGKRSLLNFYSLLFLAHLLMVNSLNILYLDMVGGIAGDMFIAAMLDCNSQLINPVKHSVAAVLPNDIGHLVVATVLHLKHCVENSALHRLYKKLLARLYEDRGPDTFELPASAVTKKLIHALEAENPHPRYFVTTPTYIGNVLRRILPTRLLDRVTAGG